MALDEDALKRTANYKSILKIVLKSQIQLLVQQLIEHTGEESLLLSANINNGNLSHFGSDCGKAFLQNCSDVKSEFLNFCRLRKSGVSLSATTPNEVDPTGVNTVSFTRKPYSRLQRKHSTQIRLRNIGKPTLNVPSKPKERPSIDQPPSCLKSVRAVDLLVNRKFQGLKKVTFADQSAPDAAKKSVNDEVVVKTEPNETSDENKEGDKYSTNVVTVEMEEYPEEEEEENFQYVLNPEYSEVADASWRQDENSVTAQNQSKRKQMLPIRITKNSSVLDDDPKPSTSHKSCLSDSENSHEESDSNHGNQFLGTDCSPTIFSNEMTSEDKWAQTGGTDSVLPTVINVGMKRKSESPGRCSWSWTEEVTETPPLPKTYMKTPQIDGIFVSRGEGRYEKLIRCDVCGKVCRTSNMARHKKRYCAPLAKKSKTSNGGRSRPSRHHKESRTSDIYIDNPTDLSHETLTEMNGSELDNSIETEDSFVDIINDSIGEDVIIKQEPIEYDED